MFRTVIYIIILQLIVVSLYGQYPCCNPILKKGQIILVNTEMNNNSFQTAGAQVINFKLTGSAIHRYTVTEIAPNRTTLHHEMQAIQFSFEGMGQKQNFDSKDEENMKGPFGPYFKDILSRSYDIIIDSNGLTRSWTMDKTPFPKPDESVVAIIDMLKPLTQQAVAPQSHNGFFSILPVDSVTLNPEYKPVRSNTWQSSTEGPSEKTKTTYKLTSFTDSTILLDVQTTGTKNFTSERMGRITKTTLNIEEKCKTVVDRKTGILKENTSVTDSNGTTEAMGGTLPLNGKLTLITRVDF